MTDEIAERFQRETADHKMTVLHDDGLYRHLRFARPDRGSYWFDLITWPGCLTVNGDCGTFTFARQDDMFEFFRGGRINPGYWAEKVRAHDPSGVTNYSQDSFRQQVMEDVKDSEPDWPGLTEEAEREIFGDGSQWNTEHEGGAREALRDFEFGKTYAVTCRCGEHAEDLSYMDAEGWRVSHFGPDTPVRLHDSKISPVEGFTFADSWEWDLSDYDWQFLWCCHAIVWGISQYDASTKPATAGVRG